TVRAVFFETFAVAGCKGATRTMPINASVVRKTTQKARLVLFTMKAPRKYTEVRLRPRHRDK
ncbi:MAG: hypothetical protein WBZ04_10655, partial [Candidatus Nanopelagicales bacterium]